MLQENVIKELLFGFFSGKLNVFQQELLKDWLKEEGSEDLFYRYLHEWETLHPQTLPDVDLAWERHRAEISGESLPPELSETAQEIRRLAHRRPWAGAKRFLWAVAAVSAILVSAFVFQDQIRYRKEISGLGEVKMLELEDGTRVLLSPNSTLKVPRFGFNEHSRNVSLSGEAEFKVTHTAENSHFVVNMGGEYSIEVLGTEFLASSIDRRKQVFLTKGSVKLSIPDEKPVYLKPGNLFTSSGSSKYDVSTPEKPAELFSWKEDMFYFDNTPMSEVVTELRYRFGVDVRIADSTLRERRVGGVFKAESVEEMLDILDKLLQMEISRKKEFIELRSTSTIQ